MVAHSEKDKPVNGIIPQHTYGITNWYECEIDEDNTNVFEE